ncbi:MAG: type II secretion system protein GspK [Maricaulaceae bacterium]|jgi:general secretion pathway protein K
MSAPRPAREDESGVVLVNVLSVVALASVVVMMMISLQDTAIGRAQRYADAAQALAHARGGELSAIAALRRDMIEAPEADHYAEPWAAVAETDAPIENGTFSLRIEDAQARFNINTLVRGGVAAEGTLGRIAAAAGADSDIARRAGAYLRENGPVSSLDELIAVGVAPADIAALGAFVVALPDPTQVNLNTADEMLLAALFNNPVAARVLARRRDRQGYLTADDLRSVRILAPSGAGFASDYYVVEVEATVGTTRQRLASLLHRDRVDGRPVVVAIERLR